jgi:hypothetical protein
VPCRRGCGVDDEEFKSSRVSLSFRTRIETIDESSRQIMMRLIEPILVMLRTLVVTNIFLSNRDEALALGSPPFYSASRNVSFGFKNSVVINWTNLIR